MEKVSRRYNKMLCAKKDSKSSKKDKKSRSKSKSENKDFFADLKKKKRGIHNARGVQKIITNRLTVRTKTLSNAVRSVFAVKEQYFNYEEDSKALLKEDLFKIIDLTNPTEQKPQETSAIFPPNKSIFREINEKFQQFTSNFPPQSDSYLISDDHLQQLVAKKLGEHKNLIFNSWTKGLQDFLQPVRSKDIQEVLLSQIVSNQSRINEISALFELNTKFRGVPLAGTCLRRKFVRRCNDLANLQNLGGKTIMISQADEIISHLSLNPVLNDQPAADFNFKFKMAITPQKAPLNLSVVSYKTPENQRFSLKDLATTCSKFRPAVKSRTAADYIELDREKCTDEIFIKDYGLSVDQQKFFLAEAVKIEQLQTLNLNSIFERPNKLQTIKKRRSRYSIEGSSPKSAMQATSPPPLIPNRKLDFSEKIDESEPPTFDFCLLEDVGKLKISPLKFGGLFTENGARKSDQLTSKRGLEAMLSPNELKFRRKTQNDDEDIYSRVKRFATIPEELGPIPTARATPQFTYRPRYLH